MIYLVKKYGKEELLYSLSILGLAESVNPINNLDSDPLATTMNYYQSQVAAMEAEHAWVENKIAALNPVYRVPSI